VLNEAYQGDGGQQTTIQITLEWLAAVGRHRADEKERLSQIPAGYHDVLWRRGQHPYFDTAGELKRYFDYLDQRVKTPRLALKTHFA
jgi:hypothetical protein